MLRIPRPFKNPALSIGMALALVIGASIIPWSAEQPQAAAGVPVSIEQFGRYIDDWSEPEGYFDSDNFISNETSYLHVIDDLHSRVRPGGIYLGVGPDQNFSYIVHTRPMLGIITDIRRQNMLEHLLFKALFAMASNRSDYLSLLVSRERLNIKPGASLPDLLAAVRDSSTNETLFNKNFAAVKNTLQKYRLKLSAEDLDKIKLVYETFWKEGLQLRFSSIGRNNAAQYPTLAEMFLETSKSGKLENYLASEEQFQWLKKFEAENRLIPIVGDFAGTHALSAVAAFLGDPNFPTYTEEKVKGAQIYLFMRLYEQYSRLSFAHPTDRPVAIAGLEKRLTSAFHDRGGAGIFQNHLGSLFTMETSR